MVYPHYGWIIYAWYPERWWKEDIAEDHIHECTDEMLEDFLWKSQDLMIHLFPKPNDHDLNSYICWNGMLHVSHVVWFLVHNKLCINCPFFSQFQDTPSVHIIMFMSLERSTVGIREKYV